MPVTIAICDDEKNIRQEILRLVQAQCLDCRIDLYASGEALLASEKEYDIYFLDIHMAGINGIQTAMKIREKQVSCTQLQSESVIIFITALREYMEAAFDVKAFHYLVKPLDENKFYTVFAKAIRDLGKAKEHAGAHTMLKSGHAYHKVYHKDILYIESNNKMIIVYLSDGELVCYGKMKEMEKSLGDSFFRCHRCYLVNMEHIRRYNATSIQVKNGKEVLLAQKKYAEFVRAYMQFSMR